MVRAPEPACKPDRHARLPNDAGSEGLAGWAISRVWGALSVCLVLGLSHGPGHSELMGPREIGAK